MTGDDEDDFGFAEICAALCERFGAPASNSINTGGECVTLRAHLEGGMQVLITDCVGTLSPIQWHLDGRAAGFFVGVYRPRNGYRWRARRPPGSIRLRLQRERSADRRGNRRLGA